MSNNLKPMNNHYGKIMLTQIYDGEKHVRCLQLANTNSTGFILLTRDQALELSNILTNWVYGIWPDDNDIEI